MHVENHLPAGVERSDGGVEGCVFIVLNDRVLNGGAGIWEPVGER
jgi:hypothetical protein